MRNGSWSTDSVREVSAELTGITGTGDAVSTRRAIPSPLPGQAASIGGWESSTCDFSLAEDRTVTETTATPYTRRNWPRAGQQIAVTATDGTHRHQIFTGQFDTSRSRMRSGKASIGLVDFSDRLSAKVSHQALFREMPSRATNGTGRQRLTGLLNTYVPNLAARAAGYYNTPAMDGFCVISAPFVGSTWPERGVLNDSYRASNIDGWARYHPGAFTDSTPASIYLSDVYATYFPDVYANPWPNGLNAGRPLCITFGARQNQATSSYVGCRWNLTDSFQDIRLAVTGSRNLGAQFVTSAGTTTVAYLSAARAGAWEYVTLQVTTNAANHIIMTITTDTGETVTGTYTGGSTQLRSRQWDSTRVYVPAGCGVNGVQVSYTTAAPAASRFKRTFHFRPDTPLSSLTVMPAQTSVEAGSLLNRQAEAELAAVWLDEDGELHWRGHNRLVSSPIVATLAASQLADAEIILDTQDVKRNVTVRYQTYAARATTRSTIVVHEGSQDEYAAGDAPAGIISPPADEEWVMVDSTPREIFGSRGAAEMNSGQGSFYGWTALNAQGEEISWAATNDSTTWEFARIGPQAWRWAFDVRRLPTGADRLKTASTTSENSPIKPPYRGLGLPLVRAMGRATRTQTEATSENLGPASAREYTHDVGWFIQRDDRAAALAAYIADQLKAPKPYVRGLEILPDPRLMLGDRIRVQDTVKTGLELTGVIITVDQNIAAGQHTMTVDLLITSVSEQFVTLGEYDDWYSGRSLAGVDVTFGTTTTLANKDSNPLR
ncbi:hypothetical protein [Kocuria sp.]|uniref:hypothetical protein n=1 Tax=Kocuria sp. TaxID=1871328 RepID=UPI0026E0EF19|nr:hypothetical protein [Kocuria sp.]MDO5619265.1 hypothetical protein [Kocuria sp.]